MKYRIALFASLLVAASAAMMPLPVAHAAPIAPGGISITIAPTQLAPAQAGCVFVGGAYPLQVSANLDSSPLDVFWTGEAYVALFAFGFDEPPGEHTLTVEASNPATGGKSSHTETLTIVDFTYPLEQVALPYSLIPLLDADLNQQELDRLAQIYAILSHPAHWDWPYALPVPGGVVTSRFGGDRVYNAGMLETHHTGTDFRRAIGEPVHATADGYVVTAEFFAIRGYVVIIDHGYGVFSQYAHLADTYVQPGQFVRLGDILGAAGIAGRTNGPHLHFEIIVNGIPVDPIRWLALSPGFVPPRELP